MIVYSEFSCIQVLSFVTHRLSFVAYSMVYRWYHGIPKSALSVRTPCREQADTYSVFSLVTLFIGERIPIRHPPPLSALQVTPTPPLMPLTLMSVITNRKGKELGASKSLLPVHTVLRQFPILRPEASSNSPAPGEPVRSNSCR